MATRDEPSVAGDADGESSDGRATTGSNENREAYRVNEEGDERVNGNVEAAASTDEQPNSKDGEKVNVRDEEEFADENDSRNDGEGVEAGNEEEGGTDGGKEVEFTAEKTENEEEEAERYEEDEEEEEEDDDENEEKRYENEEEEDEDDDENDEEAEEEEDDDSENDEEGEDDDDENDVEEEEEEEEEGRKQRSAQTRPNVRSAKSIFDAIQKQPCRVQRVVIVGLKRTRRSLIDRHLAAAMSASTYGEVQSALLACRSELLSLGVFSDVSMTLDAGPTDAPGSATLFLRTVEEGLLSANVGTYIQGQDRVSEVKVTLKNAAGWAESVDLAAGMAHESALVLSRGNSFGLTLTLPSLHHLLPFPSHPPAWLPPLSSEMRVFQSTRSLLADCSHLQCQRGTSLGLSMGPHQLTYQLTWRENVDPTGRSSPAVRRDLGHSLLASCCYRHVVDRLDSMTRPTSGYHVEMSAEVAGLGLDAKLTRFFKPVSEGGRVGLLP